MKKIKRIAKKILKKYIKKIAQQKQKKIFATATATLCFGCLNFRMPNFKIKPYATHTHVHVE